MAKTLARLVYCAVLFGVLTAAAPAVAQSGDNPLGLKPHHITASVLDIDRATRWYQDMLGFKVVDRGTHEGGAKYAELQIPGFGIGLVRSAGTAITPPAGAAVRPSWIHIVFSVPDPDGTFKILKQRGANVYTRSGTIPNPVTTFLVRDSEGNEIEIVRAEPS